MQNPQFSNTEAVQTPLAGVPRGVGFHLETQTSDPAEFEQALRPWELMCKPVSAGRFSHRINLFATTDFLLYREFYGLGVRLQGLTPDNMLLIGIPVAQSDNSLFWGKSQPNWNVPFAMPGHVDGTLAAGYEQLVAGIRLDALRGGMSRGVYARLRMHARSHVIRCPEVSRQQICGWVESTLRRFSDRPELAVSPAHTSAMLDDLVDIFREVAEQAGELCSPRKNMATQRGFERALDYIRNAPLKDVRLSRLCGVSGISERSLQYAFRDALDMTPKEFIIRRRMHATRRALLIADPAGTRVSDVATEHGFYEFGRFAGRYFRQFGEHPSDTLRTPV